jgi:TIR domain
MLEGMSGKIFINYRRGDEPGFTQALLGRLEQAFPAERLFIDVDNIPPGEDFVRMLESQVAQCDAMLTVIGNNWLDAADERGGRRLDNPNDFVRIEIESALKLGSGLSRCWCTKRACRTRMSCPKRSGRCPNAMPCGSLTNDSGPTCRASSKRSRERSKTSRRGVPASLAIPVMLLSR